MVAIPVSRQLHALNMGIKFAKDDASIIDPTNVVIAGTRSFALKGPHVVGDDVQKRQSQFRPHLEKHISLLPRQKLQLRQVVLVKGLGRHRK